MTRPRLRTAVFLLLLAVGVLGMLATGSGVWPGPSWPWLCVLVLAMGWRGWDEWTRARQRLVRRTERRLGRVEQGQHELREHVDSEARRAMERIDAVGTPDGMAELVKRVNILTEHSAALMRDMEKRNLSANLRNIPGGR